MKNKIKACFFSPTSIFKKNHLLDVNKIHIILEKIQNEDDLLKKITNEIKKNSNIDIDQLL